MNENLANKQESLCHIKNISCDLKRKQVSWCEWN